MADYDLDPSVVSYVQGVPPPLAVETPEPPIVGGSGPSVPIQVPPPPPQRIAEYGTLGGTLMGQPQPPPPPPPPQKFDRSNPGGDEVPMLHPAVVSAVQNGFGQIVDPFGGPVTQPSQVAPSVGGPVTSPSQAVPDDSQHVSPQEMLTLQKQNAATAAKQAAFDQSPEGIAQSADAEQRAAIDKERQSNADAYAAEAAQNDATAAALKAHGERVAKQAEIDQAKAAQDQANVEKYTQQYAQQIKAAADYKVDTNRDIGTRGLIAIALSGIGDALDHRHGPNTALQILDADIDKRIADQWAKKRSLGETAAQTKDVLGTYRANADDDRQAMQFQRAAESSRMADEIRQIGAQYANPAARARAEAVAAGLDQKAAGITAAEATRKAAALREAQEEADRKAHLQIAQGQLDVAYGHLDLARKAQQDARTDSDRDFALKVAALERNGDTKGAAALKAQQNDINERGVFAPVGTETVKNPDGTTSLKPTFAPLMQQDGTPFLVPKDEHKEFAQAQGAVLQGLDAVDKLRRLRHINGGQITNSEEALQATQEYARYILALHKAGGITRMSGEVIEKMEEIASGGRSPNSLRAVQSTLENSRKDLVDQYNINLRGQNYTGKRVEFPDQIKQAAPTETDDSKLRRKLEVPLPTVDDENGARRAVRVLEEQARSDDPKVSKTAIETLSKYSEDAPNKFIRQHAQEAFNRFVVGGKSSEPFFPDPEKHPGYYGDK